MKNLRADKRRKAAAFLLCLFCASVAFWATAITALGWNDLWFGGDYYRSNAAVRDCRESVSMAQEIMQLRQTRAWDGTLAYSDKGRLDALTETLAAERTNFRYQIHDQEGHLLGTNLETGALFSRDVGAVYTQSSTVQEGDTRVRQDYDAWDGVQERTFKLVYTADGFVTCDPAETANRYNQYGWLSDGEDWIGYDSARDSRIRTASLVLEYGLLNPMTVHDAFETGRAHYDANQRRLPTLAILALCTLAATLWLVIFLCRRAGAEAKSGHAAPGWQDRVPYDLYLCVDFLSVAFTLGVGDAITWGLNHAPRLAGVVGVAILTLFITAMALGLLLTTVYRICAHTLLHNTVLYRLFRLLGRHMSHFVQNWPITRRPILFFLLYLLGTFCTGISIVLIPFYQGFVLLLLCRWVQQWRTIQVGTAHLVSGDPEYKIAVDHQMFRDLREHAAQLNDLGSAVGTAVNERLQSERFKAELITNVSHDLKTPLTSIINYVDLLKKAEMESAAPNLKALEYIEVLDRKSQRLKKLTEDLVEASKASTGNLTVNKEPLGVVQLVQQALAEYEEKFAAHHLTAVTSFHPTELYVEADGRHLWRILDNLLGNCYKYALEGTRIYLDVTKWENSVTLSVKNISAQQLNVPADQLMERFIRGEESRTAEGSGLGLSIARSLTELQGGIFRLAIDGDLFKAMVTFPEITLPPAVLPPPECDEAGHTG